MGHLYAGESGQCRPLIFLGPVWSGAVFRRTAPRRVCLTVVKFCCCVLAKLIILFSGLGLKPGLQEQLSYTWVRSPANLGLHTAWQRAQDRTDWSELMETVPSRGMMILNLRVSVAFVSKI